MAAWRKKRDALRSHRRAKRRRKKERERAGAETGAQVSPPTLPRASSSGGPSTKGGGKDPGTNQSKGAAVPAGLSETSRGPATATTKRGRLTCLEHPPAYEYVRLARGVYQGVLVEPRVRFVTGARPVSQTRKAAARRAVRRDTAPRGIVWKSGRTWWEGRRRMPPSRVQARVHKAQRRAAQAASGAQGWAM